MDEGRLLMGVLGAKEPGVSIREVTCSREVIIKGVEHTSILEFKSDGNSHDESVKEIASVLIYYSFDKCKLDDVKR